MKLYDVASLAVGFILLCLLDANEAQSIFDDDATVTPSVAPTSAPTLAPISLSPTATPTSPATTAATAVPSASPTSPTTSDILNKVSITFSYQLITTSAFPNATVALSLVEQEFVRVLEELTTSNASGGRVAYESFNTSKLQPCQGEFENKEQMNLYDECHDVQSTVFLSILDPTQVSEAVVKYTVMERLQAFANDYNQNQTDLLVLLENPKYVSTNLNVILVAVSGVMDVEAMSFFEQLLAKAMAPYLQHQTNRNVSFKLLSTQILTQSPYDPAVNASDSVSSSNNNNNMTRHRHLQFDSSNFNASGINNLGNVDPNTIPFNDIQMFVQATCAGNNCTKANLEAALHGNASSYVADLARAISVNKQLLVSTYFDSLLDIFVARDLQLRDLPKYNAALFETDDVLQELQLDPPPSWMWVLCGVNVAIILVAVGWIMVQSLRRETREKDDLDKFSTAWDLQ